MKEKVISMSPQMADIIRREETVAPIRLVIMQGDLITQDVDAIVNAANESLSGGGGIDGMVHRAAGDELYEECKTLHGCGTGNAKITKGYKLKAKYIIHAVGPVYPDYPEKDPEGCAAAASLLADCYRNILRVARENNLSSIAIPAISTGIFGYPTDQAAQVVHDTLYEDLQKNGQGSLQEIRFVLWEDEKYNIYEQVFFR